MWGAAVDRKINRVAVRYAQVDEPVAVAHARVVVNGSDGSTLDEVIEPAAVRVGGRHGRLNVGDTRSAVASASSQAVPEASRDRYVDQWAASHGAAPGSARRPRRRSASAAQPRHGRQTRHRGEAPARNTPGLQASILRRLDELQQSDTVEQLRLFDDGHRQIQADIQALRDRAKRIDDDIEKEAAILQRRYKVRDVNWFPVAVEFLIPEEQI